MFFAGMVAGLAFMSGMSTLEGMQRVVMPGKAPVTLPAGPSTLYVETRSKVGEREIASDGQFHFECSLTGLTLVKPGSSVRYNIGSYSGHNAFDVAVQAGGQFELACTSDKSTEFAIAIGSGVGAWIVIAVLSFIPLLGGIALLIVTFVRRRRLRSQR